MGEGFAAGETADPTVYPTEEPVGEENFQRWVMELLRPLLERYLNAEGGRAPALVGADQFIYYEQYNPLKRFAPDIYVLEGVSPDRRISSWKTWKDGPGPSFVLEIASSDWRKDYEEAPLACDAAGVRELVVFDPGFDERPGGGARFQVFRRDDASALTLVERTDEDRVHSAHLDLWIRAVGFGDRTRLRIATGPTGDALVPTLEDERAAARAEAEAQRAAKEAALERIRELEARLAAREEDD